MGRFWRRFRPFVEREHHYLQLPARRLGFGGKRENREDALIDYVIGLESLLGTAAERMEIGYRFRIRGAVVLSKRRTERRQVMGSLRSLYNLRSRIVHGEAASEEELATALPIAEDYLRRVWHWYFGRWFNEKDNGRGITHLDATLIGSA